MYGIEGYHPIHYRPYFCLSVLSSFYLKELDLMQQTDELLLEASLTNFASCAKSHCKKVL